MQKEKLNRMLQFAEAKSCRRKILLSYFGEHLAENCGNCDVCENPPKDFEGTIFHRKHFRVLFEWEKKTELQC